jgi:hypothetical protein
MKRPGLPQLHRLLASLPGRIVLVVLTAIVVAAVIPLLFLFNQAIMPVALKFIAVVCVGIASGFAARQLLSANTRMLSMLVAFVAVYASLWLLNPLTAGYIGIQPYQTWSGPDWNGLLQLALGTIIAWLALQAWREPGKAGRITTAPASNQPSRSVSPKRRKTAQTSTSKRKSRSTRTTRKQAASQPGRQLPQLLQSRYWLEIWRNAQVWTRKNIQSVQFKLSNMMEQPVKRVNKFFVRPAERINSRQKSIQVRTRKPQVRPQKRPHASVRLTGAVEHRCPFCLESVDKKDKRGVKVCPICHTHHHADCWEVTGTCQVPHMH